MIDRSIVGNDLRRKLIYLSIPVLILGIILAILLVFDSRQPPAWQDKLDQYVVFEEQEKSGVIRVQIADHATKPWNFAYESGDRIFDHLVYIKTTGTPIPSGGSVDKPLAYPPQDLWCILLKHSQETNSQNSSYDVVFAARFSDLYNAVWVIITPNEPASSIPLRQRLSSIGCDAARLKGPSWLPDPWREAAAPQFLIDPADG